MPPWQPPRRRPERSSAGRDVSGGPAFRGRRAGLAAGQAVAASVPALDGSGADGPRPKRGALAPCFRPGAVPADVVRTARQPDLPLDGLTFWSVRWVLSVSFLGKDEVDREVAAEPFAAATRDRPPA